MEAELDVRAIKRVGCQRCGELLTIRVKRPGTSVLVCPACKSLNLVHVDEYLSVRGVYPAEVVDVVAEPVWADLGRIRVANEDLAPLHLRPYLEKVKRILRGEPEAVDRDTLLAIQALLRLGVLVREG